MGLAERNVTMRSTWRSKILALGVTCLLLAVGLVGWNLWESARAGQASRQLLAEFQRQSEGITQETSLAASGEILDLTPPKPNDTDGPAEEEVAASLDGHQLLGKLEIPALSLELPVLDSWDDEKLKMAPCRYRGSAQGNDLIIAGHNYREHFGSLGGLQTGDVVLFTDMNQDTTSYTVTGIEQLSGTAIEDMTSGDWDLTMFTCTLDGFSRITVRCSKSA